jgi:hypothetical protein
MTPRLLLPLLAVGLFAPTHDRGEGISPVCFHRSAQCMPQHLFQPAHSSLGMPVLRVPMRSIGAFLYLLIRDRRIC